MLRMLLDPAKTFTLPGTSEGLLYTMRSPRFQPEDFRPLQALVLLGTGREAEAEVAELEGRVFYPSSGSGSIPLATRSATVWLRMALFNALDQRRIPTVGGLFPALAITGSGVSPLEFGSGPARGALSLSLRFENGKWIQRNHVSGQEIELLVPWELRTSQGSLIFDSGPDFRRL
jgi:hypothetical protein